MANQELNEDIIKIIDEVIVSFRHFLNDDTLNEDQLEKTTDQVVNKVRRQIKKQLKIDTFKGQNQVILNQIKKEVLKRLKEILEKNQQKSINEADFLEVVTSLSKKKDDINKKEEKGDHKEATADSGRLIKKIKKEIKKIKEMPDVSGQDLENLEKLEIMLDEQLDWHKNQLSKRYKKEFIREDATFKAIITVLPKGVVLQAKRIVNCVNQLKEAKTNKERIFKVLELGKELGLFVATPVIFTAKFIIKHWYLLLLLLMLLKLPKFNWGKKPSEQELEPKEQVQEQEVLEEATEPVQETVKDPVQEPVQETIKEPVQEPIQEPVGQNIVEAEAVDAPADVTNVQTFEVDAVSGADMHIEPAHTPVEAIKPEEVDAVSGAAPKAEAIEPGVQAAQETEPITFQEGTDAYNLYMETIKRINERSNGQIYIREVASNPEMGWDAGADVTICRTPREYLDGLCNMCDVDPVKEGFLDPTTNAITKDGYEFMIERNIGTFAQDSRWMDVIYEDPTMQYYQEFANAMGDSDGLKNMYDRFTTVNCFETLDEFNAALLNPDPKYDFLRESFTHFINVSETQEALMALRNLGVIIGVGGGFGLLFEGAGGAMTAAELAAYKVTSAESIGLIEAFLKLLQMAPDKAQTIYGVLQGAQLVPAY